MRYLFSPIFGRVHALEQPDVARHQALFNHLEFGFRSKVADRAVEMAGAVSGLYAISPAICVAYATPRARGAGIMLRPIITPGLHYGTDLWEPFVGDVIQSLAQHGIEAMYDQSITGTVDPLALQVSSAEEVRALFAWLESHRTGTHQNHSMSQ